MDLFFNKNARFSKWAVARGLLHARFVVVDAGVQGGEKPRWVVLGDHLHVYGFDPIQEAVDELVRRGRPNRHYYCMALGSVDGEMDFFYNPADPFSSSLYSTGNPAHRQRRVPIRTLDGLLADGTIEQPDVLKMDVEGHEKHVLQGARRLLGSGLLATESETSFGISPEYPQPHLCTLQSMLLEHGMLVADLNHNRLPREAFQRALQKLGRPRIEDQWSTGAICTLNALFLRNLVAERDCPQNYASVPSAPTVDQLLKAMIIAELHGLNDIAVEICDRFRDQLSARLDADEAIVLLADPFCRRDLVEQALHIVKQLSWWRHTASLRAAWRNARASNG